MIGNFIGAPIGGVINQAATHATASTGLNGGGASGGRRPINRHRGEEWRREREADNRLFAAIDRIANKFFGDEDAEETTETSQVTLQEPQKRPLKQLSPEERKRLAAELVNARLDRESALQFIADLSRRADALGIEARRQAKAIEEARRIEQENEEFLLLLPF